MAFRYFKEPGQATALSARREAGCGVVEQPPPPARKWIRQDGADEEVPHFGTVDFDALAGVEDVFNTQPGQSADAN